MRRLGRVGAIGLGGLLDRIWITSALVIVICVLSSNSNPINRQVGISENVYITVQNDTYGNEQRVCSIDSVTYEDGDSIPTSSPCEHCICRPPGFACTIISCEYRPGCKALKRSNQCCPEYQCECEKDGKIYQNGEKILDNNNPCEVCYCQGGDVICAVIDCYWRSDCQPRYIENRCCPLYDHCPPPRHPGPIRPFPETTSTTLSSTAGWFNWSTTAVPSSSELNILTESTTEKITTTVATIPASSSTAASVEPAQESNLNAEPASTSPPAKQVIETSSIPAVPEPTNDVVPSSSPESPVVPAEPEKVQNDVVPSSSPESSVASVEPEKGQNDVVPSSSPESPVASVEPEKGQNDVEPVNRVISNTIVDAPVPVIPSETPVVSSESPALISDSPIINLIPDSQPEKLLEVSQSTVPSNDLSSSIVPHDIRPTIVIQPSHTETVVFSTVESVASSIEASTVTSQETPPVEETQTPNLSTTIEQVSPSIQSTLVEPSSSTEFDDVKNDQPTEILESVTISTTVVTPTSVSIEASETESINLAPTLSTSTESIVVPVLGDSPSQEETTSQSAVASQADQNPIVENIVEVATSAHDDVVTETPQEILTSTQQGSTSLVQESTSSIPVPSVELQPPRNPEVESQTEIVLNDVQPGVVPPKPSLVLEPPKLVNDEIIVPDVDVNNALPEILSHTKPIDESKRPETQPSVIAENTYAVPTTSSPIQSDEPIDVKPTEIPASDIPEPASVETQTEAVSSDSLPEVDTSQDAETTQASIAQAAQSSVATPQKDDVSSSIVEDIPATHSPTNLPEVQESNSDIAADEVSDVVTTSQPVSDDVPQNDEERTTSSSQIQLDDAHAPAVSEDVGDASTQSVLTASEVQHDEGATAKISGAFDDVTEVAPIADAVADDVTTFRPVVNDDGSEPISDVATEGIANDDISDLAATEVSVVANDKAEESVPSRPLTTAEPLADQSDITTVDSIVQNKNEASLSDILLLSDSTVDSGVEAAQQEVESVVKPEQVNKSTHTVIVNEEVATTTSSSVANDDAGDDKQESVEQSTTNYAVAHDFISTVADQNDGESGTTSLPFQHKKVILSDQGGATQPSTVNEVSDDSSEKYRLDPSIFSDVSKERPDNSEGLSVASVTELGIAERDDVVRTTVSPKAVQHDLNDEVAVDVVFENVSTQTAQGEVKPGLIVKSNESIVSSGAEQSETTEINRKANEDLQDGLSIELTTVGSTLGEGRIDLDSAELTEEPTSRPQHVAGITGASPSNSESDSDSAKTAEVVLKDEKVVDEDDQVLPTTETLLLRHHHLGHVIEETTRLPQQQILDDDISENKVQSFSSDATTVLNDAPHDEEVTTIKQQPDFRSGIEIISSAENVSPIKSINLSPETTPVSTDESSNSSAPVFDDLSQQNSAKLDDALPASTIVPDQNDDISIVTTGIPESFDDVGSTSFNLLIRSDEVLKEKTDSDIETTVQPDILTDDAPVTSNAQVDQNDSADDTTTPESKVNDTKVKSSNQPVSLPEGFKKLDPISDDIAQFRHDLPLQTEMKTEENSADESWYWRTINRVRRLPQFLKTLSRRPRATPTEESKPSKVKKAYPTVKHKKRGTTRPFLFW